ncbi:hypothetical protein MLD38_010847 [Melastoma candidum]|uniref:Uncharacterized protein n=1 Tax=Melastoma candidum TaxID=119954 RepID=A0ACB9R166_9MYRT|nr:hypothetical protein MLD38_010847 [Melastoma candidum]
MSRDSFQASKDKERSILILSTLLLIKKAAPADFFPPPAEELRLRHRFTMSRICVKNLPKYAAEDRLREVFSQKGEITDVKVMRTKDGKSRQFGFVGFRTPEQAQEAIAYFNKSFLDTCRISCEVARKVGDPDMPQPWSRHSLKKKEKAATDQDSSGVVVSKADKKNKKKDVDDNNNDPKLKEFLQVMQPRTTTKLWANDTLLATKENQGAKQDTDGVVDKEMERILDKAATCFEHEEDDQKGGTRESLKQVACDETVSDMDYFRSRVRTEWSDSESDENSGSHYNNENNDKGSEKISLTVSDASRQSIGKDVTRDRTKTDVGAEDFDGKVFDPDNPLSSAQDEKEDALGSGRLFVRNLPYSATEEELEELFSQYGKVVEVHIVVDKETRRSKGIAYIQYAFPESASRSIAEVDNTIFQGRLLHVLPAAQRNTSNKLNPSVTTEVPLTFKQKREDERKAAEASGDTTAWNTLFMRPDTVVETIARKYGLSKSEFLDTGSDDLAVRLALGETQVIAETKKALADSGVNVASLEESSTKRSDAVKRSNHVLLVKNLPYGCSGGELTKMFGRFGSLDKVILPQTKTMALVVFLEPSGASAAFRGLAYKRYKDAPLYLEWAPANVLQPSSEKNTGDAAVGEKDAKRVLLKQHVEGLMDADVDPDRVESRSVFVKNLSFKTSDEVLKSHFLAQMKDGKILSVRVKKHVKNGKHVSMGFGFIEFDSTEAATNICRDLQGTVLDGHALILQLCQVKKDEKVKTNGSNDTSSTKLLIKNVAFEATEKDLRKLFSPFGKIKRLRLPMKFGSHRGFAFVEFVTKQEAESALKALSSTHLYGRHLVLERAKEGESLEELRARTAAQFTDAESGNLMKLSKKRKRMAVLDESSMKFERIAD